MKPLQTERLLLRSFTQEDAARVAEICNDENIWRGTLNLPHPYPQKCAEEWIARHEEQLENETQFVFAVTEKDGGVLCGCVSVSHDGENHNGELGYWIAHKKWGRGYAAEAARAALDFCFREKRYHRVYARHYASNPASGRVMQKLGMRREGVQKEHILKDGRYEDAAVRQKTTVF